MKKKDLSNIAVTFKYGAFEGASRKKIFGAYIALLVIIVAIVTLGITMMSIEYANEHESSVASFVGGLISIILGCSILPIICFFIVYRNEKIRKEIYLWLEDAVEISAYTKSLDTKYWLGVPLTKLQVEFKIDGILYVRTTEQEHRTLFDLGRPVGYFSWVSKFADKKVNILYSSKYDQIMILKNAGTKNNAT
ncbi:MAG: hypothetical protein K2G38_01345 [Clostridia bacterium]|nr:hypothetical protein [Clostridia bacterium]